MNRVAPKPAPKPARYPDPRPNIACRAAPDGLLQALSGHGALLGMLLLGLLPAPATAQAQSQAPAQLRVQALGQAPELGRLFFTPQQRQDLDRRRATNAVTAAAVVAVDQVTVNGSVTRSSGKTATTWLNGAPQEESKPGKDPARVTVHQGDEGPGASLRVGETLDRVRGETRDVLDGGKISIQRGQRAERKTGR